MFRHDTVGRLSRVAVAAILACATTLAFAPGTKAGSGGVGFRGHVPARPNSVQPATVERVTVFSGKVLLAVPAASSGGETLRRAGFVMKKDLEGLDGVDQVIAAGLEDPQLHVDFDPARVARVTGHADRRPADPNPMSVRNNRLELILLRLQH